MVFQFLNWGWSCFLTLGETRKHVWNMFFLKPAQIRAWFLIGIHHQMTPAHAKYPLSCRGGTEESFVLVLTMLYILHPCELASSFSFPMLKFNFLGESWALTGGLKLQLCTWRTKTYISGFICKGSVNFPSPVCSASSASVCCQVPLQPLTVLDKKR